MDTDKQDLDEQISHHQSMLLRLRRRLRARELQEAEHGINVPPEVTNELITLNERIGTHEAELEKLNSKSVEDTLSSPEADYRILLAEPWDTSTGRPTALGLARLERERLRMGLSSERAQELERAVRAALVEDTLLRLDTHNLQS